MQPWKMRSPTSRAVTSNQKGTSRMSETHAAPPTVSGESKVQSLPSSEAKGPMSKVALGRLWTLDFGLWTYVNKVVALTEVEVRKLLHDQWDIITRSVQPVLWLLLF